MDLLKVATKRTLWSEVAYVSLNVALALAIAGVIVTTGSLTLAIGLALLSKWRVLAVRPRYWRANLQSNLVDLIVTISYAVLVYVTVNTLAVLVVLAAMFIAWLLVLKPQSGRRSMIAQAGIAVFFGVTSLVTISADWNSLFVVVGFWVIGYGAARHVLTAYDEGAHLELLALLWGLVFAEIGWLAHYWTVAYQIAADCRLMMPQVTVIVILASFVAERFYSIYRKKQKVKFNDIALPIFFSVSIIGMLLIFFNAAPNSLI